MQYYLTEDIFLKNNENDLLYIFRVFCTEMIGLQIYRVQDFRLKHKNKVGFSCHDKKGKCHESKSVKGDNKKRREIRDTCESRDRTSMTSKICVGIDKMIIKMKGSKDKTE